MHHAQNFMNDPRMKFVEYASPTLLMCWRIDIEYNKRLDRQRPCLEGDFSGGSNNSTK